MEIKEVVEKYKLDRRTKWFAYYGMVTKNVNLTMACSGCEGCGCDECGYKGKRQNSYPVAAFDKTGKPILTSSRDFTYA